LEKALIQMRRASALDPENKTVGAELSALRQEVGIQSRDDNLAPHPELDPEEVQHSKVGQRLGLSADAVSKWAKQLEAHPHYRDVLLGHRYRDGLGGTAQVEKM
jgi:hypothetical protein